MCPKPPNIDSTQYQDSKDPVFNTATEPRSRAGRQGTLLTPTPGRGVAAGAMTGAQEYATPGKKTLLGM